MQTYAHTHRTSQGLIAEMLSVPKTMHSFLHSFVHSFIHGRSGLTFKEQCNNHICTTFEGEKQKDSEVKQGNLRGCCNQSLESSALKRGLFFWFCLFYF